MWVPYGTLHVHVQGNINAQLQWLNMKGRVRGDVVSTYLFAGQQVAAIASTSAWIGT